MKGSDDMSISATELKYKTYLWIEDRKDKSSYIFWKTLMGQLCPEIIVESKKNNSELVKAVKTLEDAENRYIIVFDNSFDNLQIAMEQKLLKQYADRRDNVLLMDILYVLNIYCLSLRT